MFPPTASKSKSSSQRRRQKSRPRLRIRAINEPHAINGFCRLHEWSVGYLAALHFDHFTSKKFILRRRRSVKRSRIILAVLAVCLLGWANAGVRAQEKGNKKRVAVFVFED